MNATPKVAKWGRFRHWIITFHDETLEVIARDAHFVRTSEKEPRLAVLEHD